MKIRIIEPSCIPYLFLSVFCFFGPLLSGQNLSDALWIQNINWTVYGGVSLAIPIGESAQKIRNSHKALEKQSNETNQFNGQLNARPGIHIGCRASYPIWNKFRAGIGLQFTQRGYRIKEVQKYHDLIFQYDEQIDIKRIVRINVLEIPLTTHYDLTEHIEIFGGFTTAFLAGKNSAKVNYIFEKKVIANGEYAKATSVPKEKESIPLADKVYKVSLSWIGGIHFHIWQTIYIQFSGQYTGQLFKTEGVIHNLLLHGGIAYKF